MNLITLLQKWAPGAEAKAKRWFVERVVPFNRTLGIKLVRAAPDSSEVVLRLPARRRNLNVAGTVHGGAILAFAETVHGVAVLAQFSADQHRMFTRNATMQYFAPARGDLRVSFSLAAAMRREIQLELNAAGRSELTLESSVVDNSGKLVAQLTATYVIRRIKP
jgi:uncharacterized protein (TIGR00369 family)